MTLSLSHVSKRYAYKTVLDDLSLFFDEGKVHALLGENGAGKSTCAAIFSGSLRVDRGDIFIDKTKIIFASPRDAVKHGILCVRQRPLLAEGISANENILLGNEFAGEKKLRKKECLSEAEKIKNDWSPQLNLSSRVQDLSGSDRFFVSLISALVKKPRTLILDEPTPMLDWKERRMLYAHIRELADNGMNVIVITHSIEEALLYTDTITVLQKGKALAFFPKSSECSAEQLHTLLLPHTIQNHFDKRENCIDKIEPQNCIDENTNTCKTNSHEKIFSETSCITFQNITVRPKNRPSLFDVSFTAPSGELTLIHGLAEAGLLTLENVITGMENAHGFVCIGEKKQSLKTWKWNTQFLRTSFQNHVALIPSDRTFRASNPHLTIEQLLCASYEKRNGKPFAKSLIKKAHIAITLDEKASSLSGGMLQRLILAREMQADTKLVIASEPLQGLDVRASEKTISLLKSFANNNAIVIVLSSSPFPERLCKNVYALEGGKLSKKMVHVLQGERA